MSSLGLPAWFRNAYFESAGALPKRRRLVHAVRDRAMLPGPPASWLSEWCTVPASAIGAEDVAHWPYTVSHLGKWLLS